MKWILIAVAGLALLVGLLALIGLFLPREHSATCRARFRTGAEALFGVLTNVEDYPEWRQGVKSARRLAARDGRPVFMEETGEGPRSYAVEVSEPPHRLVLRIADDSLPYGGTWSFTLAPQADGVTLSITEDGFVKPALFRTLARFVFGYHATMEQYLEDLGRKLGENVTVERG